MKIKRALLSVSDKRKLIELAQFLRDNGVELIASGGTAKAISDASLNVVSVEDLTGFPEILDGRVKTLHPAIHAGILADRSQESHLSQLSEHNISPIDLVVVNLYPFEEESTVENIDIGGVALLRAAAKNHAHVVTLSSPEQYEQFIEQYQAGITTDQAKEYAAEAFAQTSRYDGLIASELGNAGKGSLIMTPFQELRYGENPHQRAILHKVQDNLSTYEGLDGLQQISGKELSYNNWLDIDAGISLISEFEPEIPACAILKHNIPCGVALGDTVEEAYNYALDCDPISAFGGIVTYNTTVTAAAAKAMSEIFLEIVIAPDFESEAIDILREKKNLRIIKCPLIPTESPYLQYRSILNNGLLMQNVDSSLLDNENLKTATKTEPEQDDWVSLIFAYRVVKHVRSNAIVLVNGNRTVGIGGGQTNRVNAVYQALEQASDLATGSILASDGFFPFPDSVEVAAQARVKAIIQPGGSIKDDEIIAAADKFKIPMILTGQRHFRH